MSEHRTGIERWAELIRGAIEAAQADGYDVYAEVDMDYGLPVRDRITIAPKEDSSSAAEVWVWGHKP